MSTLVTETIEGPAGVPVVMTGQIAAQAAFAYNQNIATIYASFNISSMVDDGTGLFTSNYTNAFANADQYRATDSYVTRYLGLWAVGAASTQFSQRLQATDAQSEAICSALISGDLA